ncbi:hypothetical protein AgCh_021085 [Apium graveolens]
MHIISRIGKLHSLVVPLTFLSSLLIATCSAFPGIPNNEPLTSLFNPNPDPQNNGPPEININIPIPNIPAVPLPQGDVNINLPFPQPPQDPLPQPPQDLLPQSPQDLLPQPLQDLLPQQEPPQPVNLDDNPVAKEFLHLHNLARRHARLPPFVWDPKLEEYAKQYGLKRKNSGDCSTLVHSMGPYGENLFWGKGSGWKPKDAVKRWVKEHRFYDQETNECKPGKMCGHYTQVVWRDTISVGCAVEICPNNDTLTICSYDPPGNYLGEKPMIHYIHPFGY